MKEKKWMKALRLLLTGSICFAVCFFMIGRVQTATGYSSEENIVNDISFNEKEKNNVHLEITGDVIHDGSLKELGKEILKIKVLKKFVILILFLVGLVIAAFVITEFFLRKKDEEKNDTEK